ncbi:MAG: hypothetical protein UU34_C0001G0090 [Candidatus Curtissbacteria bacterium GW2011_GWA1_41_11]|uniref:Cell division protein FtsL n=1 Tax=Candidatus Curtissbacteria bacterium GW2011_GWA1_41_11 TaxID=1618409 RepID=A0A0G0UGZ6_9BACT|nr:MAG: hypothetical protein UU34_C0001G0090 [Candidatus Curtissbacteria bacterium GW2011_GWA1_41_11]
MIKINDYKFKNSRDESFNLVGKVKVKLLIVLAFVVIASFFTQLVFAGNLAIGGQKLSEVENEIKRLEAENTTLKVEIAKEAALSNLAADAQKLGFEKPKQVIIPN